MVCSITMQEWVAPTDRQKLVVTGLTVVATAQSTRGVAFR